MGLTADMNVVQYISRGSIAYSYKKLNQRDIFMATRDTLIKVRRVIAEFKIYIMRTQGYLAPIQLFMIFLIFLDTTVWKVDTIQLFFGSKTNFIGVGVAIFFVGVLILGYVDTKLRLYGVEQARINAPERNPFVPLFTLWTALFLNKEKNSGAELEKKISVVFKEVGAEKMYAEFKSALTKPTPLNNSTKVHQTSKKTNTKKN